MRQGLQSAKNSAWYVVGTQGQHFSLFFYFLGVSALDL